MVSGAAGQNGRLVPEHAALVRRNGPERARTHDQQMEAKTVRELQKKLENAATEFAQVRDYIGPVTFTIKFQKLEQ